MNKKITISLSGIIIVIISVLIGYLWGMSNVKETPNKITTKTVTKWVKGDTIKDTLKNIKPYYVYEDSFSKKIPTVKDTTELFEVYKDYNLTRNYNLDFSNDTLGIFKVDARVNQNKLIQANSLIQPNIRTVTITNKEIIYKVIRLQPYAIIGSSLDFRTNKIQMGLDISQKYLIGVSGIRLDDKYGYTFDFGIKF